MESEVSTMLRLGKRRSAEENCCVQAWRQARMEQQHLDRTRSGRWQEGEEETREEEYLVSHRPSLMLSQIPYAN